MSDESKPDTVVWSITNGLMDSNKGGERVPLSIVGPPKPAALPKGIVEKTVKMTPITQKKQG